MVTGSRRKVSELEQRRVERLAAELLPTLRDQGQLIVARAGIDDIDRWRAAARLTVRRLGWHCRTGTSRGVAWVVVEDWPHADRGDALRLVTTALLDVLPRRATAHGTTPDGAAT